jgi:HD superfamily phosphodiesterase
VVDIIELTPSYFLTSASSVSLKFHPIDEAVSGGKILHTRRVFWMTYMLCESQAIFGADRECLLGAALIHDLWFRGVDDETTKMTVAGHERLVRTQTRQFVDRKYYDQIISAAECHSGRWNDDKTTIPPNMTFQRLIHTADYIASRRDIHTPVMKIRT